MNRDYEVCLIVPVFNVELYIENCITSILNQKYNNFYTVFVNDGSTDSSINILNNYLNDKRFILINQKNKGLAAARNTGIEYAINKLRIKWIIFADSDDVLSPFYIDFLFRAVKNTKFQIATCKITRNINELNNAYKYKIICPDLIYKNRSKMKGFPPFSACTRIISASLFKSGLRFPEGKLHEDGFIIPELLLSQNQIVAVDCYLYFYNVRDNSILTSPFSIRDFDRIEALQKFEQFASSRNMKEVNLYSINTLFTYIKNSLNKLNNNSKEYVKLNNQLRETRKKLLIYYWKKWNVSIFDKYRIAFLIKRNFFSYFKFIAFVVWSMFIKFK